MWTRITPNTDTFYAVTSTWIVSKGSMKYQARFKRFTPDRNLKIEEITVADYKHARRIWENFPIQNLVEYCDKYGQSDKPLLADIFQNVHNKFFEPDPSYFLSAPGLA